MKTLTNVNVTSFGEAASASRTARQQGSVPAFSGGGSDLLQQLKDGTDNADVIVNLRSVADGRTIQSDGSGFAIGGLVTLNELAEDPSVMTGMSAIAQAAASVGTPQIRNVGTLAGNVTQRPWCWYYRNGFNCFKAGGDECFSLNGENGQHAIFGGGPSFIVHPSAVAISYDPLEKTCPVELTSDKKSSVASYDMNWVSISNVKLDILCYVNIL